MTNDANQGGPETAKHSDHFLAEWRAYRGYTVRGLATAIGVSHSKVSRVETGESELRPGFAKKLARFFNIPLPALFTVNPMGEGRETAEMLDAWADIAPSDRAAALRMLRSLKRGSDDKQTG
jgi:transcriptional regulator with XRE-family HTH domain